MKKLLLFLSFVCLTIITNAQDIIILKDGSEINSKVLEVGTSEIKYKKFDNQEGPTYSIFKSDVFMVKYVNGTKDVFAGNLIKKDTVVNQKPPKIKVKDSIIIQTPPKISFKNDFFILVNGDTMFVKIIKVEEDMVFFKRVNGGDTSSVLFFSRISLKNNAFYKDGRRIFETKGDQNNIINPISKSDPFREGVKDASIYYRNYGGAVAGTVLTTTLVTGFAGLIPAIICSSTFPKTENLGLANKEKLNNQSYYDGYLGEAKKIKSRAVWTGWGIGVGVNLLCVLIFILK